MMRNDCRSTKCEQSLYNKEYNLSSVCPTSTTSRMLALVYSAVIYGKNIEMNEYCIDWKVFNFRLFIENNMKEINHERKIRRD